MPELLISRVSIRVGSKPTAEPDQGRHRTGARENGSPVIKVPGATVVGPSELSRSVSAVGAALERRGHEVVAICSHQRPVALKGRVLRYSEPEKLSGASYNSTLARWSTALCCCCQVGADPGCRRMEALIEFWGILDGVKLLDFRRYGLMFLQILWPELWVRPQHGGYGIDPSKAHHHPRKQVRADWS